MGTVLVRRLESATIVRSGERDGRLYDGAETIELSAMLGDRRVGDWPIGVHVIEEDEEET